MLTSSHYRAAELQIKSSFYNHDIVTLNKLKIQVNDSSSALRSAVLTLKISDDREGDKQQRVFIFKYSHKASVTTSKWAAAFSLAKTSLWNCDSAVTESERSWMLCKFSARSLIQTVCFFLLVTKMSVDELHQLNGQLLMQIQSKCFLLTVSVKLCSAADWTQLWYKVFDKQFGSSVF